MAVEPDPMVRRGLKRASEDAAKSLESVRGSLDVNVNEEPYPSSSCGREGQEGLSISTVANETSN